MSTFGALTDHFGILDIVDGGGTLGDILELVDSSKKMRAESRADARDENNDIIASSVFGNDAKAIFEVSCVYAVKSGTLDLSLIKLGELDTGILALTLEAATSNGEWPQITVGGLLGTEAIVAPTGKLNTFTLPGVDIVGIKQAQQLGFTCTYLRLTGSSLSMAVESAEQADGLGEPVAHGVSGGTGEGSAEFVKVVDDAPVFALAPPITTAKWLAAITEDPASGAKEPQAAYHTVSAAFVFTIVRDDAP